MVSNHRRMVWVQVSLVPIALYLVTPTNAVKKKIQRIALMVAPIVGIYFAAGWNSGSSIFKPVAMMHSVVDGKADPSTLWRDIENFDLIATIKDSPLFGTGYGRPYLEVVTLPAVDYPLERFLPHNSILGMLSYSGYFGFAMMTMLWPVGAFFAMRSYYAAKSPLDRAAAISCFGVVLVYLIQCWGDLGLGAPTGVWLLAPAIATAGKLAVANGGWQDKQGTSGAQPKQPRGPVAGAT
jgi:O-antigen ligase